LPLPAHLPSGFALQNGPYGNQRMSEHARPIASNWTWSPDISHIWMQEGWPYLAIVMDPFSRRIIG